jgi:hypothetical protein
MYNTQTVNRNWDALTWGALLIWWGIAELFPSLPDGTWAIGIGVILIGLNAARALKGLPTSRFTTTLGILALVAGVLGLAGAVLHLPFNLPVFAILLLVLGIIFLVPGLNRNSNE